MSAPPIERRALFPRAVAFFRRHPILLLLCLTPGIPEYLSSSTSSEALLLAPGGFLVLLALNLGLYGPGALLVREALVRWRKGWASFLCLGAAYGLLEEGTALATVFDPRAPAVGILGAYGRLGGVNWIWTIGVVEFHVVLSLGVPLLLLGLALPAARGRSLLGRPGMALAFGVLALDIVLLAVISAYPAGLPFRIAAVATAALLAYGAYRLPGPWLEPARADPPARPWKCAVLGALFFPLVLAVPAFGIDVGFPAPATGAIDLGLSAGLFFAVRSAIGPERCSAQRVALAAGLVLPLAAFGLLAQLALPVVLVFDVLAALFFSALWRRYGAAASPRGPGAPTSPT